MGVFCEEPGGLGIGRGVRVGVREKGLNGRQDRGDVVDRAPVVLQDVQAYGTIGVD